MINQNLSVEDVQVKLDISDEALRYVQNVCDIHKSRQQITETMQKTNKKCYGTDYFDVSASNTITLLKYQQLSGDKRLELQHNFQHEYIDNDNSIESVCSILNINAELATYLKNVLRISKSNARQLQTKRKTFMNRYRTEWPTQSEQVRQKIRQFDSSKSEAENMLSAGYVRVYDSGNAVYVWREFNKGLVDNRTTI